MEDLEIKNNIEDQKNPSFTKMSAIAFKSMTSFILGWLEFSVVLAFCGHLEDVTVLPIVGLAISISNITVLSTMIGFNFSMDTLMPQAAGLNDIDALNTYLNKTRMFQFILWICLFIVILNMPLVLVQVGQEEDLVSDIGNFIWIISIANYFNATFDLIRKQFVNRHLPHVPTFIMAITSCTHILVSQILIIYLNQGQQGAAFSVLFTDSFSILLSQIQIKMNDMHSDMWFIRFEQLKDMQVLQQGLFGISQLALEWWSFEFVTIMIGTLGPVTLGCQTVGFQLIALLFMIPLGISSAASFYVGGCEANGLYKQAKVYWCYSMVLHLSIIVPILTILQIQPNIFINLLTNDKDIQEMFGNSFRRVVMFLLFSDTLQGTLAGTIRGLGMQDIGFQATLIQWIWNVPVTYFNVQVWKGDYVQEQFYFNFGSYIHATSQLLILIFSDWSKRGEIQHKDNSKKELLTPNEKIELVNNHV